MTKKPKKIIDFTGLRGLTTLGTTNVITSAITGIFWMYLARLIGTSNYGEISYLISIATIAATLSSLGAGTTMMIYTAKEVKIQSTIYYITIISSMVGAIVLFLIMHNTWLSIYVVGYVIFTLAFNEILGQKSYSQFGKYAISQKILQVALALILYYLLGNTGIILGLGLAFYPYLIQIYKRFKESKIDFSLLKPRLGFMLNNYMLELTRTFSIYLDKLIIFPMFGSVLLGNYQLGTQILMLLSLLPNAVFQYVLSHDASGNQNKKLKLVTVIISIFLASITIILAPIVLPIFFPTFNDAVGIVQITSLAIIPLTINAMYISRFLGNEKTMIVLIGSGMYLTAQIIGILFLGRNYGPAGIASSLVIATSFESLYLFIANYRFKNPTEAI